MQQVFDSSLSLNRVKGVLFALSLAIANPALAKTDIVLLGSGTPIPISTRVSSGIAVVVNGNSYLFDAGQGVWHNSVRSAEMGYPSLASQNIKTVFITHLHSDHTLDLSSFMFSYWWRRTAPLNVVGPKGINHVVEKLKAVMEADFQDRMAWFPGNPDPALYSPSVTQIKKDGIAYRDSLITVEAFKVEHAGWEYAFAYKVITPDIAIFISGDTTYSEKLAYKAKGVNVLFHEVYDEKWMSSTQNAAAQAYHRAVHTQSYELGDFANIAQPGLLVLYHVLPGTTATLANTLGEVQSVYGGPTVMGHDLDVFSY
jgi:ribonuclease BN (tRNA processing enzyme)